MSRYLRDLKSHGSKGQQRQVNAESSLADEYLRPQQVNVCDEVVVLENANQNQIHEANASETFQNETNENPVTEGKKHRGRTILAHVHSRSMEKRPLVLFNDLNQPVGPDKDTVHDFSHLLGSLAKDSSYAPLNCYTWKRMPSYFKDKIWDYVQKRFIVEKEAKKYVLQNVNVKWRLHKTRVKETYYKENETMEQRMAKWPGDIPVDEFMDL